MGIHGEQGKHKAKWMENHQLMGQLLDTIHKQVPDGELVVMINSLGNVTNIEMTLIVNDVMKYY